MLFLLLPAVLAGAVPNPDAVVTPRYAVRLVAGDYPSLEVSREGHPLFRFPVVSGLSTPGSEERLSNVRLRRLGAPGGAMVWEASADSSLWRERLFRWTFSAERIEFQHFASGERPLERCYFFSNGISERWENGNSPGVFANTTVYATRYFSPRPNHADQSYFTIAIPQSVGIAGEAPEPPGFQPLLMGGIFAPPPLFLAFESPGGWAGLGIGAEPGGYTFNTLEYSGSRYAGASFWVHYGGYRTAAPRFSSPRVSIDFAWSEWDALARHVAWLDANGLSTRRRFPVAAWHRRPIFCGWAEQTREAAARGLVAHDLATQARYEEWLGVLEGRGLPVGTVVIDDKWQKQYGTFEVDEAKWPDLRGFVARQHAKGRRVLLWVPVFHAEGLPGELCVRLGGQPVAADVSHPGYESLLRERIRHLVRDLDVDGFKEDWIGGMPPTPGLQAHAPLFGIEFVRRFQFLLHDEAHRWKADAMVETQTPNPLFRESSDVLRLNDVWYGARGVPEMMRRRARIAAIAGWDLVDCDNASSTNLEEWWSYMREQPSIGIPALYFVHRTESTFEEVPEATWRQLKEIWDDYVRRLNTPN
ncbi:MAG TPA: TIM-barrel domain-containing protein [Vicinamibacteria bacterium]|nr:TIM-barrel domain-containing protein [Vicinamibacteria bacterium]